jgi:hypothetical protein
VPLPLPLPLPLQQQTLQHQLLQDEAPLLNPNVLICSVGTEIFYRTSDGTLVPDQSWEAYLDKGWDRAAVEAIAAKIPQLKQQVRQMAMVVMVLSCTHCHVSIQILGRKDP